MARGDDPLVERTGLTAAERRLRGRIGGLTGWAQTPNRRARMRGPQAASPSEIAWHARKLGYDPDLLTDDQRMQAESARKLYFAELSAKSASTRKRRRQGGAA